MSAIDDGVTKPRLFDDLSPDVESADASEVLPDAECRMLSVHEAFERAPVLNYFDPSGSEAISFWSAAGGLLGLGTLFMLTSAMTAIALEYVQRKVVLITFADESMAHQLTFFPTAAVAGMILLTVSAWYVPIWTRFASGWVVMPPGLILFFWVNHIIADYPLTATHGGVPTMMYWFIVCGASVGLLIQLCLPWSLMHLQLTTEKVPQWGISRLMELTAVFALLYFGYQHLTGGSFFYDNVGFGLLGAATSGTAFLGCRALLMQRRIDPLGMLLTCGAAWLTSASFISVHAVVEFGWIAWRDSLSLIATLALVGMGSIMVMLVISLYWLRYCGWKCVR
ncbi:MAG: hypothetical protein HKN47_24165 [Pirellulaceae bacterium]|nr:hypothetical protein [Pirellulaceae bacterium]